MPTVSAAAPTPAPPQSPKIMIRRYVNLVALDYAERVYSIRRMDPYKQLFYPSTKAAIEAADEATMEGSVPGVQTLQLPHPCMNFSATDSCGALDMFALFSPRATSEGRIVYASMISEAGLYDAEKHVHITMGTLNSRKGMSPMCMSMAPHPGANEDSMYVLDRLTQRADDGSFEVLEYVSRGRPELFNLMTFRRWRLLPPPPFVHRPGYQASSVNAFTTVVDDNGCSIIYVSCSSGIGTYRFETARHDPSCRLGSSPSEEWSYVGPWTLPFTERAHYVPEFNLWLGFLDFSPYHLCAMDLSAIDPERAPPTALQVWQDLNLPDGEMWIPVTLELVNLGYGKFLIAKIFELERTSEMFAVLTGIEMMIAGDQSIKMVKHKCARFNFGNDSIEWVL